MNERSLLATDGLLVAALMQEDDPLQHPLGVAQQLQMLSHLVHPLVYVLVAPVPLHLCEHPNDPPRNLLHRTLRRPRLLEALLREPMPLHAGLLFFCAAPLACCKNALDSYGDFFGESPSALSW